MLIEIEGLNKKNELKSYIKLVILHVTYAHSDRKNRSNELIK